VISLPDQSM